jgi:hypothetical protein
VRRQTLSTLIEVKCMEKSTYFRIVTVIGVIGFGVLMGLRSEISGTAARSAIAALAFACGAVALVCIYKARW